MRLTFLGTSAANAFPEAFCLCENCREARRLGGKSLRKRSSLLINEDLLIDMGPDIMAASQMHNINLTGVQYCLQTHPHADHLDLSHFLSRSPDYGVIGASCLNFYASSQTLQTAAETFRRDMAGFDLLTESGQNNLNLKITSIQPYSPFQAGSYLVTAFPANHSPNPGAFIYAINQGNSAVLYAADTASFFPQVWDSFQKLKVSFDLVIFDHTYGPLQAESDHLNAEMFINHVQKMKAQGFLKQHGLAYATHIAHEGNPPHPLLSEFAEQNGYSIAYDGLTLNI